MTDDLVKRLRTENALAGHYGPPAIQVEAADRIEALEAALVDATAALAGAASAYRTYARRSAHLGRGPADALFTTRVGDFDKAVERARRVLKEPT